MTVLGVVAPTVPLRGPTNPALAVMVVPTIVAGVVPPMAPGTGIDPAIIDPWNMLADTDELPKTIWLLAVTWAPLPRAVELITVPLDASAPYPIKVSLVPVVIADPELVPTAT